MMVAGTTCLRGESLTLTVLHSSDGCIEGIPDDGQLSAQNMIWQGRTHQPNTFHLGRKNVPHLLTMPNELSHFQCRGSEKGSPRLMWSSYSFVRMCV